MHKRVRRPSPALVISLVALFVALGGTGYAALTINGKNIKNKSIAGKKLKNKTITAGKVKNKTLTGGKLKNDTVTGTQVRESSLGKVPSATKADSATSATSATSAANAAAVDGSSIEGFNFVADTGDNQYKTIGSVGGVSMQASCNGAGTLGLRVISDVASSIHSTLIGVDDVPDGFTNPNVSANSPIVLFGSGDQDRIGWLVVGRPGNVVTIQYSSEQDIGTSPCEVAGTMVSAPTP